ncbi:MAG: exodeoxyribonuclease VII small subunit [Candidatus Dojkabacteria bacterium]
MASKKKQGIQANVDKLDEIIEYFEQEDTKFNLDEAIRKYEEAMKLVQDVRKELESVELRINEIQEKYSEENNKENGSGQLN